MAVNPVQFLIVLNGYNLWTEKTAELYEISEMAKLHFDGSLGGYHFSKGMTLLTISEFSCPKKSSQILKPSTISFFIPKPVMTEKQHQEF